MYAVLTLIRKQISLAYFGVICLKEQMMRNVQRKWKVRLSCESTFEEWLSVCTSCPVLFCYFCTKLLRLVVSRQLCYNGHSILLVQWRGNLWRHRPLVDKSDLRIHYYTCGLVQPDVLHKRLQYIYNLYVLFFFSSMITRVLFFCASMEVLLTLQGLCHILCQLCQWNNQFS